MGTNIFEVLFPIGFIVSGFIAYLSVKKNWRIAKWF